MTRNPALTAKVEERQGKLARLAADKKISDELFQEGQKLLYRMPRLKAQQDLRKDYQKLADGQLAPADFVKSRDDILALTKLKRSEALEYAEKIMQAIELIKEGYVKDLSTGEMVGWALTGLLRRLEEKKLYDELRPEIAKAKTLKTADLRILLANTREKLGKREDLEKNKDVDISVQQMMSHLDPYTNYIDAEMKRRFEIDTAGRFYGIGIQIRKDATTDQLLVVTPIRGSPAYRAGIKTGDLITQVSCYEDKDGKPLEEPEVIVTKGLNLSDAVKRIMGKPGTRVRVTVKREGEKEPLDFEITRGAVEVETVLGVQRKKTDDWEYVIDRDNHIAYVRLTQFAKNTYRDLVKVVDDLEKAGVKGLILDLRFNPGGLLDSAVRISDLFIDDGLIVSIRPRVGRELSYSGETKGSYLRFPMVCLINTGSASASEIVSACLQDHHRAKVMGERSYGKATVQTIADFEPTGGKIKMTTATYWRPSGKNINKSSTKGSDDEEWGVMPDKDFHIKLTPKERDDLAEFQRDVEIIGATKPAKPDFKDKQLDNALEYLRGQIKTVSRAPAKKAG
jgi:C-terminal peptidase prc